ncbi:MULTISPECIES: DUF4352 domain-containing protein [Enterococcus]|uniref:DUF4352 domain-containing protein n=1 Tax=Candidatus Enterococcus mangumiae TaxID=2230878 RepID=A0ABZ2SX06_9ENTE|nr:MULTISPECIES: DUF4352 domain-containing protein [unclassified Enterococcus]MBO0491408.1 DUF4352 domain-containing protein [Enterococcus sp. DIV1094]MBO1301128.1 DUF4352 domain-containing protein [Enterococcus sp. DIV1271a]
MKKLLLFSTILLLSLPILTSCKNTNNHATTTTSSSALDIETQKVDGIGKATVIDGLEITINKPEKKAITDEKGDKILYTFHVKGKNISSVTKGLGSIDFSLETKDGKQHSVSTNYTVFGQELDANQEIEGDLYFELNKNDSIEQLIYLVSDQKHIAWDLNKN